MVDIPVIKPIQSTYTSGDMVKDITKGAAELAGAGQVLYEGVKGEETRQALIKQIREKAPMIRLTGNESLAEIARGLQNVNDLNTAYEIAKTKNVTLPNANILYDNGFRADPKTVQNMVETMTKETNKQETEAKEASNMKAIREGVAKEGTVGDKISSILGNEAYTGNAPAQSMEALKLAESSEKNIIASQAKANSDQIKAQIAKTKTAIAEAITKAKLRQADASTLNEATKIQKTYIDGMKTVDATVSAQEAKIPVLKKAGDTNRKLALEEQKKADMFADTDPELVNQARQAAASYLKLASDADDNLLSVQNAITDLANDRAEYSDALTNFKEDMYTKHGVDLVTPIDIRNNPEIKKGKKSYGLDTNLAPAPIRTKDSSIITGQAGGQKIIFKKK